MDSIKCNCGNNVRIGANFCSKCGSEIEYQKIDKQLRVKETNFYLRLFFGIFGFIVVLIFLNSAINSNHSTIDKSTEEYEHFAKSFETVMSFYPEITAYKIDDRCIILRTTNKGFNYEQGIAATLQTIAHNTGIIDDDHDLQVKFYYGDEFIRSFY